MSTPRKDKAEYVRQYRKGFRARNGKPFKYDLTGKVFGNLTVLEYESTADIGYSTLIGGVKKPYFKGKWRCKCACGNTQFATGNSLRSGQVKSCGCLVHDRKIKHDLTGRRFGRLVAKTVVKEKTEKGVRSVWECVCDCGKSHRVMPGNLLGGSTTSCGCYNGRSHGDAARGEKALEYQAFCKAKARCQNVNDPAFPDYGGRGIEFRFTSYDAFLECVGRKPSPLHSLDRIDNDGHYEAGNVRWATRSEQARNRRKRGVLRHINCPSCSVPIYFQVKVRGRGGKLSPLEDDE